MGAHWSSCSSFLSPNLVSFAKLLAFVTLRLFRPSCHKNGSRVVNLYIRHRNMSAPAAFTVPEGFTLHKENTSAILLPADNDAFLNPVQEFNRDLSVACIRTWGEVANAEKEKKWRLSLDRRAKKAEGHKAKKAKSGLPICSAVCLSWVRIDSLYNPLQQWRTRLLPSIRVEPQRLPQYRPRILQLKPL